MTRQTKNACPDCTLPCLKSYDTTYLLRQVNILIRAQKEKCPCKFCILRPKCSAKSFESCYKRSKFFDTLWWKANAIFEKYNHGSPKIENYFK